MHMLDLQARPLQGDDALGRCIVQVAFQRSRSVLSAGKWRGGKADGIRVCLRLRDDGKHQTFGEVQIKPEIPARGSLPRNLVGVMGNRVQDC